MEPRTNNNPPPGGESTFQAASTSNVDASPNPIAFPDGLDEKHLVMYCKARNDAWDKWFGPQAKALENLHKMFRNRPTGKGADKAVPVPIGYGIIESVNAKLAPTVLNRPKYVEALPEEAQPDNELASNIEAYVNQQLSRSSRKPNKGKALIKSGSLDSVMIWRNVWRTEVTERIEPQMAPHPMTGEPTQIGEQVIQEACGYWDWELENLANMAWDPHTVTKIQDSPFIRKKSNMSYSEMLRWQAKGLCSGVERLRKIVPSGVSENQKEDWAAKIKAAEGDKNWAFSYSDEKAYKVQEWEADLTWQDGEETKQGAFHWFLVEDKFVISFGECELKPVRKSWASCPFLVDPNSSLGISLLGPVQNIQEQINTYASYQDALGERAAKPLILYDDSSGMKGRTAYFKMYGMQPVTNINGIKEFNFNSGPFQEVQAYINFLIDIMRDATGANEQFQGQEGADTATEFQGLVAAAGSRFQDIVDTILQGVIEAMAQECYLFTQEFGEDGDMVVLQGNTTEGQPIVLPKAAFQSRYRFQAVSAQNEQSKQAEVAKTTQLIEMAAKLPPSPDGRVLNIEKLFKDIILPSLGQKNGEDWFMQLPPQPPMMPGGPSQGGPVPPMLPPDAMASSGEPSLDGLDA